MKQVFTAYNLSDAYFFRTLLEAEGISSIIRNEFLLRGQASPDGHPSVWILDDCQFELAASIASRYINNEGSPDLQGHSWKCPKCGEVLESQFTTCWQCGTDRFDGR